MFITCLPHENKIIEIYFCPLPSFGKSKPWMTAKLNTIIAAKDLKKKKKNFLYLLFFLHWIICKHISQGLLLDVFEGHPVECGQVTSVEGETKSNTTDKNAMCLCRGPMMRMASPAPKDRRMMTMFRMFQSK